jgi:hypothetical protein
MGCAFEGDKVTDEHIGNEVFPAITANYTTIRANFGEEAWRFGPPDIVHSMLGWVFKGGASSASAHSSAASAQQPTALEETLWSASRDNHPGVV